MVLNTHEDYEIQCWIGRKANMDCRVEVKENITIPPAKSMMIPVHIRGAAHLTEYGYIEGRGNSAKSVVTVPGILETMAPAPVVNIGNYGDSELTLHRNESVGSYAEDEMDPKEEHFRALNTQTANESGPTPEHLRDLMQQSSEHLDKVQNEALSTLLLKYGDVFSRNDDDIGRTDLVTHRINTESAAPIRQRARRMPLGKQEMKKAEVKRMLEKGIIEPSKSPWASNIVLVQKKNGEPRFCLDYRPINKICKRDAYKLPWVDECLDALADARWFSSIDLNSGFWLIGMCPEDKEKQFLRVLDCFSSLSCLLTHQPAIHFRKTDGKCS